MDIDSITNRNLDKIVIKEGKFTLPKFLRQIRIAKGVNIITASNLMGIKKSSISYLEKGYFKKQPSEYTLRRIATFYRIDPEILLRKSAECFPTEMRRIV